MIEVPLTQGFKAKIDDCDFGRVFLHEWCILKGGGYKQKRYAQSSIKINGIWKRILMHRFIMEVSNEIEIDHIDNDGLNNQRDNLRIATDNENQYNSYSRQGTSIYKGVSWHIKANKWISQIMINNKYHYLGLFENEIDAALAYDDAAKKYHGEFARLNFG